MLDSGAIANFVSEDFVADLSLPAVPLAPPIVVSYADGKGKVATHNVWVDLTVGSLQFEAQCTPTVLAHYDVVLGKPWSTRFNPEINWKHNVVSLQSRDFVHVFSGGVKD